MTLSIPSLFLHLRVCLFVLFRFRCVVSLFCLSLFPWSLGFSETHQMGRAAAYLISQHARGSIVNHLGQLSVTHQHISEQGHDTGARWLSSSWQG